MINKYFQRLRIYIFRVLSKNNNLVGRAVINQPVIFNGLGKIQFGENVHLGYNPSGGFFDSSIYVEARDKDSYIEFGNNVYLNNGTRIVCDKTQIILRDNVLIGTNVEIIDSDFHGIHPDYRRVEGYKVAPVLVEENVFIGSNSRILKGVTIGKNSVVANSSVVFKDVPENTIVGGNPARVIKSVFE